MVFGLREIAGLLEKRLLGELPGPNAHSRMAPSDRIHGIYPKEPNEETINGGVLILLYPKSEATNIVLIQRPEYPGVHSSQISFPGGKSEKGDKTIEETAIRESEEEIGISSRTIRLAGRLSPLYIPLSNILVYPIVGFSFSELHFSPDPNEVCQIIEVDLEQLLDPSTIQRKCMDIMGQGVDIPFYDIEGMHIWGATAMIISEFLEIFREVIR